MQEQDRWAETMTRKKECLEKVKDTINPTGTCGSVIIRTLVAISLNSKQKMMRHLREKSRLLLMLLQVQV